MFVKETKVKRAGREYSYLQLVEGYRDERGKVRHRVVANLGRKDVLKESGQLEALGWESLCRGSAGGGSHGPVPARGLPRRWPGRGAASARCCWSSTSCAN